MIDPTSEIDRPMRWDLSNVFPGLESEQLASAITKLSRKLKELDQYLDNHAIGSAGPLPESPSDLAEILDGYLIQMNGGLREYSTIRSYLYAFSTTDSYDSVAKRKISETDKLGVQLRNQEVRFRSWLKRISQDPTNLETAIGLSQSTREHVFYLQEAVEQSHYQMPEAEEALAAELNVSGANAWSKLQRLIISQLKSPFQEVGEIKQLPLTVIQTYYRHPEEMVRRQAYEAEISALESVREPLAACLNGIKGTVITLEKRRGRHDILHGTLGLYRIDQSTLEAMLAAMAKSFPAFRRYYHAKANRLGKNRLAWWDLEAPINRSSRRFTFVEAQSFIMDHFNRYSPHLAAFSQRAFEQLWIDATPRAGKSAGAFCMAVPGVEESRILANFDGSYRSITTLAHELGHAYHNHQYGQAEKTLLNRRTPMTLAETASTFAETIVTNAALANAQSPEEVGEILEVQLHDASQIIVDIYSRYLFESEVFERRAEAELSADELCEIMLACQRQTYGDGLDEAWLHPYMWAWKPHYYNADRSFYNFPYAFGLLFGLGLYQISQTNQDVFMAQYNSLLADTGSNSASALAQRFGIDLSQPDFWSAGIAIIEQQIDQYVAAS